MVLLRRAAIRCHVDLSCSRLLNKYSAVCAFSPVDMSIGLTSLEFLHIDSLGWVRRRPAVELMLLRFLLLRMAAIAGHDLTDMCHVPE